MIPLSLSDLADAVGARLEGPGETPVLGVSIDTRSLRRGEMFVALEGARDGHEFLGAARERGACGALVRLDADVPSSLNALRVKDPLEALGNLAVFQRERLRAKVVAITGSAGKTSAKDLAAAVLGSGFRVTASHASFNNEIGVPLTILSADLQTEVIVAEVGARGIGHIRSLMPMLSPDIAIITNLGAAHIGMFGSLEAIAAAKGELIEGLRPGGCAILNADDERVASMKVPGGVDVLTFGLSSHAGVSAKDVELDRYARASFVLVAPSAKAEVSLCISGEHMVSNALAAAAAGIRLGISIDRIAQELGKARMSEHRMALVEARRGWTVIDDTYNASPASVVAALKALRAMARGRRTWAVLGHMAELGDASSEQHDLIGRLVVRLGIGKLVTVGEAAKALHEAARLEGMSSEDAIFVPDATQAAEFVLSHAEPEDIVLVKAARVAALEHLVEAIAK